MAELPRLTTPTAVSRNNSNGRGITRHQSLSSVYGILRTRQSSWKREKTMFMKRFTRPFRQLRGKLTLSYTLTSVVSFLLVELIFITVVLVVVSLNLPAIVLSGLKQEAPQAAPYFV